MMPTGVLPWPEVVSSLPSGSCLPSLPADQVETTLFSKEMALMSTMRAFWGSYSSTVLCHELV